MNLYQPSHCITSIQCTLRATQYVYTLDVGIVEIESGFVDVGDIVYIQSDGRRIDARADTTDINRRICLFLIMVHD